MYKYTKINSTNSENISDIIKSAILGAIIAFFITRFVIPSTIKGESMYPGLNENDIILVNVFNKTTKPGEVIAFDFNNETLIKRVIATEGDLITIKEGNVYINNKKIEEPYTFNQPTNGYCNIEIPAGYVYVLGDNRGLSFDSRLFGLINVNSIKGKMIYKFP